MSSLILVVDDEEDVASVVERTLRRAGFDVLVAYRGADALEIARRRHPDLIVLDEMMPGMSGTQVCRYVRANPDIADTPILFLTARGEIDDKIIIFESGADDHLTKGKEFDIRELELRVRALLRRARRGPATEPAEAIEVGNLRLDRRTFEITTPDRTVLLTPVEFDLMSFLMSSPDRVFSAEQLLQEVWGYPPGTGLPDLVRVHARNIRAKIESDPSDPTYLKNILRRGYMVSSKQDV